jgi:FkbM family methyltransferase
MIESELVTTVEFRHGRIATFRHDRTIGQALRDHGEFGEDMVRALLAALQPGDVAIDVGANIGAMTVPMARKVGPRGRVVAIESQRMFHACLCANLLLNDLTGVDAIHAAAGARTGDIAVPQIDVTKVANFGAVGIDEEGRPERVRLMRIDDLGLERCAVLKSDVEGLDWFVLQGAAETIARFRPVIFMEAKAGPLTRQAIAWLHAMDYGTQWHFCRFISTKPLRGKAPPPKEEGALGDINIVAVPREHKRLYDLPDCASPDGDWKADYERWREQRADRRRGRAA